AARAVGAVGGAEGPDRWGAGLCDDVVVRARKGAGRARRVTAARVQPTRGRLRRRGAAVVRVLPVPVRAMSAMQRPPRVRRTRSAAYGVT
ncbi:hypothetical protein AN220_03385, partial [Streptomyces nanshensis]